MIEETAVVVKTENRQVWVESGRNSACGGCQQKASCTTHALGGMLKKKPVPVDSSIQLKTGDRVIVAIDESLLLRAALVLYLVPLIALFAGAGIADWLLADHAGYADLWIAGGALLSFFVSLRLIGNAQYLWVRGVFRGTNAHPAPVVVRKV